MVPAGFLWFQMIYDGLKCFSIVSNGIEWYWMGSNGIEWFQMILNGIEWSWKFYRPSSLPKLNSQNPPFLHVNKLSWRSWWQISVIAFTVLDHTIYWFSQPWSFSTPWTKLSSKWKSFEVRKLFHGILFLTDKAFGNFAIFYHPGFGNFW